MREINNATVEHLYNSARLSKRRRSHLQLHSSHSDKVQRVLIGLIKESYVEPHFHELKHQWEMFVVLKGEIKVCIYSKQGDLKNTFIAGENSSTSIVEFSPGDIHSVECISEEALMLEIKEGPFDPMHAKSFPKW